MASKEHQPDINKDVADQFPSLRKQTENVGSLLANQVMAMLEDGSLFADDFEQKRRFDICLPCEHYTPIRKRCKACGCFIEQKVKFTASSCPIGKW